MIPPEDARGCFHKPADTARGELFAGIKADTRLSDNAATGSYGKGLCFIEEEVNAPQELRWNHPHPISKRPKLAERLKMQKCDSAGVRSRLLLQIGWHRERRSMLHCN